jgi:ABC-type transport system substrate-binding protein
VAAGERQQARGIRAGALGSSAAVWLLAFAAGALGQQHGGQLSYSSLLQVVAYEPISNTNLATTQLSALMFETLVERNPHGSGVVPMLAESFQSDPNSITFQLKRNVKWHDGESFSAEDVKFTTELLQHPKTVSALKDEFAFISGVEVLDPFTVRFSFRQPLAQPENFFLGLYVIPRHRFRVFELDHTTGQDIFLSCRFKDVPVRKSPSNDAPQAGLLQPKAVVQVLAQQNDWFHVRVIERGTANLEGWTDQYRRYLTDEPIEFFTEPVGTGPYQFKGVDTNGNIVLEAYSSYHRGPAYIDRVRRRRSSDKNTMINRLISDVLDLIPETPFEDIARIRTSGVCQTVEYPSLKFAGFAYNCKNRLLSRREVRRAFTLGLNRQELLQTYYQGHGTVLPGPFSPHSWGYDFELEALPYDPQLARDTLGPLLSSPEAKAKLKIIVSNDRKPEDYNVCQAFVSVLQELGFAAEVATLERSVFDEALERGNFDIAYLEWIFDYSYNIRPLFFPGGALNFSRYSNPALAAAFDRLDAANTAEARLQTVTEIQQILREDCPYTFLWSTQNVASVNRKVSNIKSSNIDPYSFFQRITEWWIAENEE